MTAVLIRTHFLVVISNCKVKVNTTYGRAWESVYAVCINSPIFHTKNTNAQNKRTASLMLRYLYIFLYFFSPCWCRSYLHRQLSVVITEVISNTDSFQYDTSLMHGFGILNYTGNLKPSGCWFVICFIYFFLLIIFVLIWLKSWSLLIAKPTEKITKPHRMKDWRAKQFYFHIS